MHSPSVPLTPQLLALLGERKADNVPLFEVSSANAMFNTLKALDGNGFTVHGFCSSFEDWGAEATSLPRDLVNGTTPGARPIGRISGPTCWRSAGRSWNVGSNL